MRHIQEYSSGGVPGPSTIKRSGVLFLCFSKSSTYFTEPRGVGVQLFPGESNCLFPIETHITCDFPGGGGSGPPVPAPAPRLTTHQPSKI